jgi:hypothetical protein
MKIFIRDKIKKLYLTTDDQWTADVNQARDFKEGGDAISHAAEYGLTDIELYYAFPEKTDNFVLPLQSFDHTRPRSGRKPPE